MLIVRLGIPLNAFGMELKVAGIKPKFVLTSKEQLIHVKYTRQQMALALEQV